MKRHLLLALLVLLAACHKDSSVPSQSYPDVAYGNDAQQKMDIYLPAGRNVSSTKTIVLIHGGAWASGDKTDFNAYVDTLRRRMPDYAIVNINYRLATTGSNHFPTQENDVKAAIEFIVSKASEYRLSQKIVLLGASAGGHLALLQGYKYSTPVRPKAIIDFFGPTDLTDLYNHPADPSILPVMQILLDGTPTSNAGLYQQSSPISFVSSQSPATLILQGGQDPLVPVSQATSLNTALQTNSVTHQYVFYPGEGHGWVGADLVNSFDIIQTFLATNVK